MFSITWKKIAADGLWRNNPGLVQLLGLCPLLAVTGSVVNALGLGVATLVVLTGSNLAVSLARNAISEAVKLPVFVMLIAAFTTCIELLMQAFTYELYQVLGIFIPLIVTNCVILGRAEAFACKHNPITAAWDGFTMGAGFLGVLVVLGGLRELIGTGQLFSNMHLLLGDIATTWTLQIMPTDYPGFLVAILPPGAFLMTGVLIALKNVLDAQFKKRQTLLVNQPNAARRVRTTGQIV